MQYGTPFLRLLRSYKTNTEPSQSTASNPIGTEKRHSVRVSCAGPRAGGGREHVTTVVRRLSTQPGGREGPPTIAGLWVSYPFSIGSTASTAARYWTAWSEAAEAGVIRS